MIKQVVYSIRLKLLIYRLSFKFVLIFAHYWHKEARNTIPLKYNAIKF